MNPIVTVTLNPAVDKSSRVEQVLPERKLRCGLPRLEPGGGGINVARAVVKLGGKAHAIWARGGLTGELLHDLLEQAGVEQTAFAVRGKTRENLTITEERSGHQFRFGMPGAPLEADEQKACLDLLESLAPAPRFVVLSGSLPPGTPDDFYGRLAARLPRETRVVLDTSGPALREGVRCGDRAIFLVKPNIRELGAMAGKEIRTDRELVDASRRLINDRCVEVVVTSLGPAGAALVTRDAEHRFAAPVVPIRSKVGAGDSMVAGIVLALERGKSLVEAVRFGIAAGAAAVMTPGTELCRREDTEQLYDAVRVE